MPKNPPHPEQETRNDDPQVQEQQEQKARGDRDQAEGERSGAGDERIPGADEPRGDRIHGARAERRPGGGRKGQPN